MGGSLMQINKDRTKNQTAFANLFPWFSIIMNNVIVHF